MWEEIAVKNYGLSFLCIRKDTGGLPTNLAVRPTVVVYVRGRPEPELRAVLPAREHHRKVVLPRHQELPLLLLAELGDAADQVCDVLS